MLGDRLELGFSIYDTHGPASVRRLFVHNALLQNRLANQSHFLCGTSLGSGKKSLFAASGSHDQDGRHAHIW